MKIPRQRGTPRSKLSYANKNRRAGQKGKKGGRKTILLTKNWTATVQRDKNPHTISDLLSIFLSHVITIHPYKKSSI